MKRSGEKTHPIRTSLEVYQMVTALAWEQGVTVAAYITPLIRERITTDFNKLPRAIRTRAKRFKAGAA